MKKDNINILALDEKPRTYHKAEIDYKVEQYMSFVGNNIANFLEAYNQTVRENNQPIYSELEEDEFASILGLSLRKYQNLCKNNEFPIEVIIRLAIIFGVNPLFILCGKDVFLSHYNNANPKLDRETFQMLWNKKPEDLIFEYIRKLYKLTYTDIDKLKQFFKWYKDNQSNGKDSLEDLCRIFAPKFENNKIKLNKLKNSENNKKDENNDTPIIIYDMRKTNNHKHLEKIKKDIKKIIKETLEEKNISSKELKNDARKIAYNNMAYIDIMNNEKIHSTEPPKNTKKPEYRINAIILGNEAIIL